MMKTLFEQTTVAIAGLMTAVLLSGPSATAAVTFEQQDVDQDKFIVLAAPSAKRDRYNLVILEQITDRQPCWQEQSNSPGMVLPLLLNFDFTNICGRSLSQDDYSIRQAGQDLSSKYRLSLVPSEGVLVLMGTPYKRRSQRPSLEIGRTQTVAPGFLKIELAPGWRLTQRTHRGKRLDHLYLTRDVIPTAAANSTQARSTQVASRRQRSTRPRVQVPQSVPATAASPARTQSQPPLPFTEEIEIPVPPPTSPRANVAKLPPPPQSARSSRRAVIDPPPVVDNLPPVSADSLSVPAQTIPLGNADNEPDVFPTQSLLELGPETLAADPNPPLSAQRSVDRSQFRYRVFVNPGTRQEEALARDVVPDAFNASHQGRRVLQVGAFEDRIDAEDRVKLLQQYGFRGKIVDR